VKACAIDNCSISLIEHLRRKDQPNGGVWRLDGVNLRPWLAASTH
jgi:hypothetical protein